MTKRLTLRKIIAAIKRAKKRENIPWTKGTIYDITHGSSCAVGLATRALYPEIHPDGNAFYRKAYEIDRKLGNAVGFSLIGINDSSSTFETMIERLENKTDVLDVEFEI